MSPIRPESLGTMLAIARSRRWKYKAYSDYPLVSILSHTFINNNIPAPIDSLSFKYSLAELFRKNWSNTVPIIEFTVPPSTSP